MFDLSAISTMMMPTILVLGLCVGYIVKNLIPNDSVNRFIPLIVGVVGLVAGIVSAFTTGTPITLEQALLLLNLPSNLPSQYPPILDFPVSTHQHLLSAPNLINE